jgi:GNAT superfamily N-acetyltransferase
MRRDELPLVTQALANRSPVMHRERLTRQDQGVFTYLIAWVESQPVGHVGINWPDDRRVHCLEWGYGASVHDLEVVPERRNHGVGRSLMLEVEELVRQRGLATIGLSTGLDDGYAAARHLYRSLGYVRKSNGNRRFIAGPASVYICEDCVDLCAEILEEEREA